MRKQLIFLSAFIFSLSLFINSSAQNIFNYLGGNTENVSFGIFNSDGDTLFWCAGNGFIGIDTVARSANLHVNGDEGVLFTGNFGIGSIPTEGRGTRMMWHPAKAAFRAGHVGLDRWNDLNIGDYSTAMGYETKASGNSSTAMGWGTTASGGSSTAMGYMTEASGGSSTAMGYMTEASGSSSTAMGAWSTASGEVSIAIGRSAWAGNWSTAMGYGTTARGDGSTAMGFGTTAGASGSTAIGLYTIAQSYSSCAIGRYNVDNGDTIAWNVDDYIFTIGDGTPTERSNCLYVKKNGDMWIQGTLTENSDIRLKSDINKLHGSINKIKQLNGVNFYWRDTESMSNKKQIGLIAQDVEKVFPELVGENEGYKTTNYIGLIPVLIEALKEQQQTIDDLKSRIGLLEKL